MFRRIILFSLALCFLSHTPVLAGDLSGARMFPEDKVTIYRDGVRIGAFTNESPCPEDVFLFCDGKCAVKLEDALLLAEDQSLFSISTTAQNRILNIKKGRVYFGLSSLPRHFVLLTPEGAVSAERAFLNASGGGRKMIEGYVDVSDRSSEVALTDGGSLSLRTRTGEQLLRPGNRMILLAQADPGGQSGQNKDNGDDNGQVDEEEGQGRKGAFWLFSHGRLAAGGAAAVGLGYLWGRANNGGHHQQPASPSRPR